MTGSARHANCARRFAGITLLIACLNVFSFASLPAFADQKTNQEPVRTTMPGGQSTHASKFMMAPVMTADERNALYLQWGLTFAGIFIAVTAVVVWIFLSTRKESGALEVDDENAYSVPVSPPVAGESTPASSDGVAAPTSSSPVDALAKSDSSEAAAESSGN